MSFVARLKWFFKQQWLRYTIAITLIASVSMLTVIPPKLIGDTVDLIRSDSLTQSELREKVLILIGLALLLYIMVFTWITTLFGNSALLEKLVRGRLLAHMSRMTPGFYQRNSTGQLMALASNDVLAVGQTAGYGVMTLVNTVVGASVVMISMISLISWKLMVAALIPMPLLVLVITVLGRQIRDRFTKAQDSFGRMNDQALESISGIRVIRSYVQEDEDVNAFDRVTDDVIHQNQRVALIHSLFQPIISLIVGLSFTIGIGYGAYLVMEEVISLGELISFNLYLGMLIWPMISFGEFINVLQRGTASAARIDEAFMQEADVQDDAHPVDVKEPTSIEMKHLSFRYPGAQRDSLTDVSFRLEKGQTLGIVGKTGSGKTTLLKQFLRQYRLDEDSLFISEVAAERIEMEIVKSWMSYVPQEHLLLSKTIRENICLGKPHATDEQVNRVIEMASLAKDISQMPKGLNTLVGEHGVMLSGGQKQRVSIARALLMHADILILDDCLSAVDAKTESHILEHIRRERVGKTTLIAAHRLSSVSHADWILVLDQGRVIEEGTHEELLFHNGWYKQQWDIQQMEASLQE
ncbi:ABC transporter ATP-binding protein [Marinicrinis sediminis]|uniref:ABC transporter ATP-binding protein n=1 Tax=Marinicrinis sediminis TaxID=1652465 RepID=A0ABW5RBK3_9BACL